MACDWGSLCCGLAGCLCAKTGAAGMRLRGHFHLNASLSKIAFRGSLGLVAWYICEMCAYCGPLRHWGKTLQRNASKLSCSGALCLSLRSCCGGGRVARVGCLYAVTLLFSIRNIFGNNCRNARNVCTRCFFRSTSKSGFRVRNLAAAVRMNTSGLPPSDCASMSAYGCSASARA